MRAARLYAVGFAIRGDFREIAVAKLRLVDKGNGHAVLQAEQLELLVGQERLIVLATDAVDADQIAFV